MARTESTSRETYFTGSLTELLPSKLASLWIEELTVSFSCLTAAGQKEQKAEKKKTESVKEAVELECEHPVNATSVSYDSISCFIYPQRQGRSIHFMSIPACDSDPCSVLVNPNILL